MLCRAVLIGALTVVPTIASAQAPCTTDARRVVDEVYRHVLERAPDAGSNAWVDRLVGGSTVREVVRDVAKSPEHIQRFGTENRESVIRTMYRHLLNREPDPQGLRTNVTIAARRGLPVVIDEFVNSQEYQQSFGDWGVPGSSGVNYCAPGQQSSQNNGSQIRNMRFRRMDANGDGQISRNEWRGNNQSFQNFDWNNDGVLSGDEVSVGRGDGEEARNDTMSNDDRFDYLDVNGNGFVDRNEWDGGYNAFDRLDANRDRRLTRDEYDSTGRSSNFASVDLNRDGRIVLMEWPWSHRSFDQQDANGDGVISRNEYKGSPAAIRR
jgi:Ca2+-binding EF-hand superfamily protein